MTSRMGGLWPVVDARTGREFAVAFILLLVTGCSTGLDVPIGGAPGDRLAVPPRVSTPMPVVRTPVQADPGALPPGARAHFPAYEGDPVFVSLPVRARADIDVADTLETVIAPILKALGLQGQGAALVLPPPQGIAQPKADFKRLAQAVADAYERNPKLRRPKTQDMLDVFRGARQADREKYRALPTGEGMTFAQYVAGIERLEIQYPFQQTHHGVPIEHSILIASRWEGQAITSVYGSILGRYRVENTQRLTASAAIEQGARALRNLGGIESVSSQRALDGPHLVLLPYDTDATGTVRLRHAYRMLLRGTFAGQEGDFLVWLDADNGVILRMRSFLSQVLASGLVYNRDPGVGTTAGSFEVDPSSGSQYTLQRSGVSARLDYRGDGYDSKDVSILGSANFDDPTLIDAAQALCGSGTNKGFQQVNFFATLMRHRDTVLAQGMFTPFPVTPWSPKVETTTCGAWSYMNFGACRGYTDTACPNYYSGGKTDEQNLMNFAHDNTMIAHELGHHATASLTDNRPSNWCGMPSCTPPHGWGALHDLADFWGAHLESTPCIGGWVAKNMRGINASLNCLRHSEGGSLPRKIEVLTPPSPTDAGDRFPEHRKVAPTEYGDGQIGGAALWEVREGMWSKGGPSGLPQFGVRFQSALKQTGVFAFPPEDSDTGVYQHLYDLEAKMTDQWATSGSPNGPDTTNKVTAGFARAGIFLIPYQCLDGKARTKDATSCPLGESGGDAVIDVDDNDPSDDPVVNGVTHREVDFLKFGGPAPTFHVWTGPRYRLAGEDGAATYRNPSPCNSRFQVEASTGETFLQGSTVTSAWKTVTTNPGSTTAQCYGTWTPTDTEWTTTLQAGGANSRLYYRARTQNAAGGNERLSTLPGNGLWTVPPPYAVISVTGQSDY